MENIVVNFEDGSFLEIPNETGVEDDIGAVVEGILSCIQMKIDNDKLNVEWKDAKHIDIVKTVGIKSVATDNGYRPVISNEDVKNFIDMFHRYVDISYVFTRGCCYWFAKILHDRFPESKVIYIDPQLHFVTEIDGRLYDITGDVTEKYRDDYYHLTPWDNVPEGVHKDRIMSDSVLFDGGKYFYSKNNEFVEKIKILINQNATEGNIKDMLVEYFGGKVPND